MSHNIVTFNINYLNRFHKLLMLPVEILQRICLESHAAESVRATCDHSRELPTLWSQHTVIGYIPFLKLLFKALQMIVSTGFAVDKVVDNVLCLRFSHLDNRLNAHSQVNNTFDNVKTRCTLYQKPFHSSTGSRTEFQNRNPFSIGEHLDEHRRILNIERIGNQLRHTSHFRFQFVRSMNWTSAAENRKMVVILYLITVGNAENICFSVRNKEVYTDFLAHKEFFDNRILCSADILGFLKSYSKFLLIRSLLHAFGAIGIDRFYNQRIVEMIDLFYIQLIHNNIARCGNIIFNKDFLHQFLVGNEFSSFIIDVPRKTKFFGHLGNDQKNLICAHGNGKIDLLILGDFSYTFDIKDIDLIKLIRVFFCKRCGTSIHKNSFNTTLFQFIYQSNLRQSAGYYKCFHLLFSI